MQRRQPSVGLATIIRVGARYEMATSPAFAWTASSPSGLTEQNSAAGGSTRDAKSDAPRIAGRMTCPPLPPAPYPTAQSIELEYRGNLVELPSVPPVAWANKYTEGVSVQLASVEAFVVDILDRFFLVDGPKRIEEPIQGMRITPLSSRLRPVLHESGHPSAPGEYFGQSFLAADPFSERALRNSDPERFTTALEAPYAFSPSNLDFIDRRYIVGHETESATYFDTPDDDLCRRGIAVRDKWFGPGQKNGCDHPLDSRALFAKVNMTGTGSWTERREITMQVPPGEVSGLKKGLSYLLHQTAPDVPFSRIVPRVRIHNNRFKLNVCFFSGRGHEHSKVGFITVDDYRATLLDAAGHDIQHPPVSRLQLEVEILPRFQAQRTIRSVGELVLRLESTYGVRHAPAPKSAQAMVDIRFAIARNG